MKVSVYGASGFVGSNYASYSKNNVEAVDRNDPNPTANEILYLIGTTDNYNVLENAEIDIQVNLIILMRNLEYLRHKFGKFTFNYVSSWFVYGDGQTPPFREDGNCKPKGFYSISKYAAEMYIESYCKTFEIDFRIIRLANVFGCNDKGISRKKNALQYLVERLKSDEAIELYEAGEFFRDYIDVRDVVTAIDLIIEKAEKNQIINVGTGVPQLFSDIINEAVKVFGSKSEIKSVEVPDFHKRVQVKNSWLETSKLVSLGFMPAHPIMKEIINL
jgi:nucleoside-diphosphate-sugar epimerase